MRFSCILGLLAMCFIAQASEPNCTRRWPTLWQCRFKCQHGYWGLRSFPGFTVEDKPDGTPCWKFLGLIKGECKNGRCVKRTANMTGPGLPE
uniref:Putative salivary kunitz domain protein n=1 Tax=Ixodes ricinus TaxID=34613 RepID=A0A0K8RE03_IXORI